MVTIKSDPQTMLLDAATRIVARGGMRALSHRAVETEAGFAHGSTSYHLGTRDQIIEALLRHVAEQDILLAKNALHEIAVGALADGTVNVDVAARQLLRIVASDRERLTARYELLLEASRRPALRASVARWRAAFVELCTPLLARIGAADPSESSRWLVAALDGLLLNQLCLNDDASAALTTSAVRGLLKATLAQGY